MSMDFTRARDAARDLIATKKPGKLSTSALTPEALRDHVIAEEEEHTKRFRDAQRTPPEIPYMNSDDDTGIYQWSGWREMLRDVARASYGFDEPRLLKREQIRPSHRLNREVLGQAITSPDFSASRPYTRGNPVESMFNALAMADSLKSSAATTLKDHIARASEMESQEQAIDDAQSMLDSLREQARALAENGQEIPKDLSDAVKAEIAARKAARDQLGKLADEQATSTIIADAATAAKKAAEAGAQASEMFANLPGLGGGASHTMPIDRQFELAKTWASNPRLREIAQMVGRMYRDMRFRRETRTKNVNITPVGITTGREFQRMLPQELARAGSTNPLVRATFLKDWAAHACMEWDMEGMLPAGKGPIVCLTDGSASMKQRGKIIWANSLALSLMMLAQREHRPFVGVQFGSGDQCKSWYFPKGVAPDPEKIVEYAGHLFGGGTDTFLGLEAAVAIVRNEPEFRTADVVLIADGEDIFCDRSAAATRALEDLKVRRHGISILAPGNEYMTKACDYCVDVTSLVGPNDASTRIAQELT